MAWSLRPVWVVLPRPLRSLHSGHAVGSPSAPEHAKLGPSTGHLPLLLPGPECSIYPSRHAGVLTAFELSVWTGVFSWPYNPFVSHQSTLMMSPPLSFQASQVEPVVKNPPACRRHKRLEFDSWVGKIPWRTAWQPIPVFLPGEFPRTEEPGGLQSTESQRVGHDWSDLAHPCHYLVSSCLSF